MSLEDVNLHLIDSVDSAFALMRWLGERPAQLGAIALDTETTGLSPERDRIRLAQIGDDRTGWAIPYERWGGVLEEVLKKWDGRIRMHNATFDAAMLKADGIHIDRSKVDDTRIAGHILEPTESTALKNQTSRHVDARAASLQRALDEFMTKWTWATVPIDPTGPAAIYWQYGALDAVLTFQLGDVHLPRVRAEAPRAYELELAVAWVVSDMERRGARIDRDYTQRHSDAFLEYIESAEKWCRDNYGVHPGSNQDVVEVLIREGWEHALTERTSTGNYSLTKDILASIDHPLAQTVLRRRQVQKLQSTYLRRFLEYSEWDGFLHPHINSIGGSSKSAANPEGLYGVRTGRMSMDQPNLQQLPRRSEKNALAAVIRNCIIPRDENHILLMSDFDQIEMRVLAHLANDDAMRAAFGLDVDFFTHMARQVYGDPSITKSDHRRQVTKNAGYAKAYGAGAPKFAKTAGITLDQALEFLANFDRLYPGVRRFQQEVERVAFSRLAQEGVAYVTSPLTGRRHVADPGREYALVNYMIQGTAAEIFKTKLLELAAAGLDEYMILPVHDEIILDVPRDVQDSVVKTIRDIMNDDTIISVPITAGVASGERWGEKVDIFEQV